MIELFKKLNSKKEVARASSDVEGGHVLYSKPKPKPEDTTPWCVCVYVCVYACHTCVRVSHTTWNPLVYAPGRAWRHLSSAYLTVHHSSDRVDTCVTPVALC